MTEFPAKFFSVCKSLNTNRALHCRFYNQKVENKLFDENFIVIFQILWEWINTGKLDDPHQAEVAQSLISPLELKRWKTIENINHTLPSAVCRGLYIVDGIVPYSLILGGNVATEPLVGDQKTTLQSLLGDVTLASPTEFAQNFHLPAPPKEDPPLFGRGLNIHIRLI